MVDRYSRRPELRNDTRRIVIDKEYYDIFIRKNSARTYVARTMIPSAAGNQEVTGVATSKAGAVREVRKGVVKRITELNLVHRTIW